MPNIATIGYVNNILGRFDEAEEILKKRIEIAPESFGSYAYLANVYFFKGQYDKALEVLQKERLDGFKYAGLAMVHFALGDQEASDEALAFLKSQQDGGWDYQVVEAHSVRGELDEAFAAMDEAYENRDTGLQLILGDRYLANLRDDPRFEAMVSKLGLRVEAN